MTEERPIEQFAASLNDAVRNIRAGGFREGMEYKERANEAVEIVFDMERLMNSAARRIFYNRKRAERDINAATAYRARLRLQYEKLKELGARNGVSNYESCSEIYLKSFETHHSNFCNALLARRAGKKALERGFSL